MGGTLDNIAGDKGRAPESMQKLGMEWLWRMTHEGRFKKLSRRYLRDTVIFSEVGKQKIRELSAHPAPYSSDSFDP